MIGKTISHYKILEKLGEGGMGVVYKAEDTKLKRTVALKFLPPHALGSEEEKTRFVHEAQAAAALSHPNICTVYEIDDVDGQTFIAMEYVKGESLKEKIAKGPLKLKDVIQIGIQAADGLNEAHRKQMTHRDIKSGNIMITENNRVKIMDFGLAKLTGRTKVTKTGTTVGTISYMSPEQIKGEKVDHRSDIWSLGVVLYEMISGQFPFPGEYEQAVVYNIMNEEPEPLTGLRTGVPIKLEEIVNKLFAKDPENRYQHIDELPVDLKSIDLSSTSQVSRRSISDITTQKIAVKQKRIDWRIIAPILVITALIFTIVGWLLKPQPEPESKIVSIFPHPFSPDETFYTNTLAISPDGTKFVYGATTEGVSQLYFRKMDQLNPIPITSTGSSPRPFFSPDGKELAFFYDNALKKVFIDGGSPVTLCDDVPNSGGTWGDDGTIIFRTDFGLSRVSSSGGIPEVILAPDSGKSISYYRWPEMLPDSKAILYTVWEGSTPDEANIAVLNLETGESEILIREGTRPLYSMTGHILFGRSGSFWAVPFDAKKLKITGREVPVLEGVDVPSSGDALFRVSSNGNLIYIPGAGATVERSLVLVNRNGDETLLTDRRYIYGDPRFSPDGTKVSVTRLDEESNYNIWIHDINRNTPTLLTPIDSNNFWNSFPVWTPDGQYITFISDRSGVYQIYRIRADGTGNAELLCPSENTQNTGNWSMDGTLFAFSEVHPETGRDIWIYTTKDSTARPFLVTQYNEFSPAISPDGKWISYVSNRSGQNEIYIRPYPGPGGGVLISTQGGIQPVWARDGSELYYREGDKMMAVSIETQPSLKPGIPELLFEESYHTIYSQFPHYDIHPHDNRFLMIKSVEDEPGSRYDQINIVLNWFEVLKEKMAGAGE
ncbi:serine/threonine-protein kinase [bacterium]|nr:serine/threonine-protein kinase [bacterium]